MGCGSFFFSLTFASFTAFFAFFSLFGSSEETSFLYIFFIIATIVYISQVLFHLTIGPRYLVTSLVHFYKKY
jgi:hypothetical protein